MENVFKEAYDALLVTKQRMAEIELGTADGSDEIKVYDHVQDYLASGRRLRKASFRNEQKRFCLLMGSYTTSKV